MATTPNTPSAPSSPSWFTPKRLLAIFCIVNFLNYLDRGAISSNGVNGTPRTCTRTGTCSPGTGIQGDFSLTNFEDGVISSAFMVGLLLASPIFASLAKSVNPFRLIGAGLSVWTVATACCGASINFWSIAICRMLVGVGEASFVSLASPFIDDNAPVAQKTAWLGIFYMCIPAGVAIGYVYGGLVGTHFNWRYAFFGEAILMLPFAILGFVVKPLQMKGFSPSGPRKSLTAVETPVPDVKDVSNGGSVAISIKEEVTGQATKKAYRSKCACNKLNQLTKIWEEVKILLLDKVYVVNVLGYVVYNFVIGAYSYWGPKAGYSIYDMTNADMVFGGITLVSGIFGTLSGGYVLDRITSTVSNAFKLLTVATFLGEVFCFSAFWFRNIYAFVAFFSIGEMLLFATQGPVNYICLHCVKPSMRPISMAMSTVSIHIFGDVPSSPLVGVLQDSVKNWRETALILTSILFLAAGIWFIGIFFLSADRFNEEREHTAATISEESNTRPPQEEEKTVTTLILEEKKEETTESSAQL